MADIRQQLLAAFELEHREHLDAIRAALDAAAAGEAFDLRDAFRRAHSLKGAARAVDMAAVEALAHEVEAVFAAALEADGGLDPNAVEAIAGALDTIERRVAERLAADRAPAPPPTEAGGRPEAARASAHETVEYVRVDTAQIERLGRAMHDFTGELQAAEAAAAQVERLRAAARTLGAAWEQLRGRSRAGRGGERRLGPEATETFDRTLAALMRDLTAAARSQGRAAWAIERAAAGMRAAVEGVSLAPADSVFGGAGRMVRDLVRETGLDANVSVTGMEVQADRAVLQALKDPVTHLLRNAVGHGAEPAGARAAAGKPAAITVGLDVRSEGGRLVISVWDDGRGPDLAGIEAAAVERGLLPVRDVADPAPAADRLLALPFESGFSTAGAVDRLSGRGMGLSVVAEAVRKLRGWALLRAREPAGAEVVISVPFSTARQDVLLVSAGGGTYALPTASVERLLRLRTAELENLAGQPTARIKIGPTEVSVPVVPLAALLGGRAESLSEAGWINAVLVRHGERRCAFAVSALKDVRTMLVAETDAIGADPALVAGAVMLEDETAALALSPEGLLERWARDEGRLSRIGLGDDAAQSGPTAAARRRSTILVVDDSITTRTLEKGILEAHGYRVLLSVDGVDALRALRGGETIDLVLADVEMPRMDGFGLLQAIKADAALSATPVILMTSRSEAQDIRRGLDLGADAYITKQKFDQRELLASIGQLL